MNKKFVNDRLFKRQEFKGQLFPKPSLTIPGQDLTPQEIMKLYVISKDKIKKVYTDTHLARLENMSKIERTELLHEVKETQNMLKANLDSLAKNKQKTTTDKDVTINNDNNDDLNDDNNDK